VGNDTTETAMSRFVATLVVLVATTAAASGARAADGLHTDADTAADAGIALDVEVDPIAYALGGYSVHAGLRYQRLRFDLGAFAAEVPEGMHGQDGFEQYAGGFGVKVDYTPFEALDGLMFGASLNVIREDVRSEASGRAASARRVSVGGRVGYEIDVAGGFYVLPWFGVDVFFQDRAVTLDGERFDPGQVILFPTVHLGYRI
jgi:hypothetical protein